jgi:hypothetical protein
LSPIVYVILVETTDDAKYPPMKGTLTIETNVRSIENIIIGAIFAPTSYLQKYVECQSSDFVLFLILHNIKNKQKGNV